ncbi:MAG: ABC transporter permease [Oscillospiraceae bacterium]|nr:ABC transporter permease [Oscillospiraceae bacterium]MBQ9045829.1 ABC transporter permease [Oscillospiraceae bacterium]
MLQYFAKYYPRLLQALLEHLEIVLITLLISIALAAVLTLLIRRSERLSNAVVQVFGAVYSIPSLALFALLIPITGLGEKTAILVLVVYNQFLLIRNFLAGLESVDKSVVEAAYGMGMSEAQVLSWIELPLSAPLIIAGVRLALISTIGIATIAATINAGGLGNLLFDGMRTMNTYKILWGALFCAVIALLADGILKRVELHIQKKAGMEA